MQRTKNHYIKYSRTELESYTRQLESCVKKINCIEPIKFSPALTADFQSSILKILSNKIGKYDARLNGVVLDFRNTKVLGSTSLVHQDSPFSSINVETNFYVFVPRRGAVVSGIVKYINKMSMETIISVLIYRVFNVKITIKGKIKQELQKDQKIKVKVKDFHFENVIPFVEGEIVSIEPLKTRLNFDDSDILDSGISESSTTLGAIKQERESSVDSTNGSPYKKSAKRILTKIEPGTPPYAKKIKMEPASSDEESSSLNVMSSKANPMNKDDKDSSSTYFKTEKRFSDKDDFETSLQMLLSSV